MNSNNSATHLYVDLDVIDNHYVTPPPLLKFEDVSSQLDRDQNWFEQDLLTKSQFWTCSSRFWTGLDLFVGSFCCTDEKMLMFECLNLFRDSNLILFCISLSMFQKGFVNTLLDLNLEPFAEWPAIWTMRWSFKYGT